MTTFSNEPARIAPERPAWPARLLVPEMWASLAITVMWLAVLFDAVFGPDIVITNGANSSTVPSAVAVAAFAFLGTWVVARHGFDPRRREDD
jgi:hypothetical protein